MTNAEQYSDVFTNINISPTSRAVALKAKGLLDLATGQPSDWESDGSHTSFRLSEQSMALQAFWDRVYDTDSELKSDKLVITVMKQGLTIALERRRRDSSDPYPRQTLFMNEAEGTKIYRSDHLARAQLAEPTHEVSVLEDFTERFQATAAAMGLHRSIVEMHPEYRQELEYETAANY